MLDRGSWWPAAEGLRVGQRLRVNHACGHGRTLLVSRDSEGFHAYCFRCNDSGFVPPPAESISVRLERLTRQARADKDLVHPGASLPVPQITDVSLWPAAASLWLYRAGLGRAEIGRFGVYYHPPSDRVILPVPGGFWQARAYQPGRLPKYLGPAPRPAKLLPRWGRADIPTLTEDILSAMKLGLVSEGIAVLGTRVSDHILSTLMARGVRVNVWLDPDTAGRRGAAKICKQLRAYGLEVRDILSARDPKLHTLDEIKEHLR